MPSWSVTVEADGDRPLGREEIVALADAVARHDGVASGIGQQTYGVQILVEAPSRDEAAERAKELFAEAVREAGLPPWPVSSLIPMSEQDELEELFAHEQREA
ncbi:hypothetical protein G3I59_31865 [Amycolatopsis rubida]|uniref:Uncharacterized protein n=2 Tax=Amycolatopsis TaxID=1813 RepID=A0A2N3WP51_9PSEU|nr:MULTISPECIES: hypothetical protein [Amycolatopsis]MYW95071.1 hypothetical protein [Amycolatopsis rubida]NEC60058.1 hypothetical protein [Amycolatopsis rubida]OAP26359.1 hypothetical protein A4R44_02346 [Amycolatopsis sp. M39]PKV95656.1 hypothetical protein ATK30_6583 [Amycolatopsis niigatensis]SFP39285.1 hypothetical protein SAMN05421854_105134 [Amycolatopsis rubida]